MRLVTFVGVCDEVSENEYAANDATYLINTPGLSGGEKHQYVGQYAHYSLVKMEPLKSSTASISSFPLAHN